VTLRVLAVDDQPKNLRLMREVLKLAGLEVREARSGSEALAMAQEAAPDLILLDMHLPDMHGLEVLRRLRETSWGAGLRVVAMSAAASAEDRKRWEEAGCLGSIEKPIVSKTFKREISRWLPGGAPAEVEKTEKPEAEKQKGDALGEILVAASRITQDQLKKAMTAQAESGRRLAQVLVEQGAVSENDIAWALTNQLGYPYIFLTRAIVDEEAARLLPESFLRERRILPVHKSGEEIRLAMADPADERTVDEVVSRTGLRVNRSLALPSNINEMLDRLFSQPEAVEADQAPTTPEAQHLQFHLVQALHQGASEVHFDPGGSQGRVRYRLQGTLVDRASLPADLYSAVLRHLRDLTDRGRLPSARRRRRYR
jgi:CheY-like chemotaxis protein